MGGLDDHLGLEGVERRHLERTIVDECLPVPIVATVAANQPNV